MKRGLLTSVCVLSGLILSGCGGGGGGELTGAGGAPCRASHANRAPRTQAHTTPPTGTEAFGAVGIS